MKMGMYTVHDAVASDYAPPFFAKNDGSASRMFNGMLEKSSTVQGYTLVHLGFYDMETGLVTVNNEIRIMGVYPMPLEAIKESYSATI